MMRVRTVATGVAGSPFYTNLYFAGATESAAVEATQRVTAFWTALRNTTIATLSMRVEPEVAVINPLDGETSAYVIGGGATITGNSVQPALPYFTQGLIRLTTAGVVGGRRVQGRIFIPGLYQGAQDADGTPSAGFLAGLSAGAGALTAAGPSQLVVWSRPVARINPPLVRAGTQHNVIGATARDKFAVLRSRRD